jgi:hypothetical protein
VSSRGGLGGPALDVGQRVRGVLEGVLDLGASLDQRGLVGDLLLEQAGELHEVVGEQPQAGVAGVGLDHAARRATSAWRPSGFSWRRISPVRSCTGG